MMKYCLVPCCKNNSVRNKNKLFIRIPQPQHIKEKWYKAIKVLMMKGVHGYICEDHFKLEDDAENWMKFKLSYTSKLMMKKDILPHLNLISNHEDILKSQMTPYSEMKRRNEFRSELENTKKLKTEVEKACCSQNIQIDVRDEASSSGQFNILQSSLASTEELIIVPKKTVSVAVQFSAELKDTETQIFFIHKKTETNSSSFLPSKIQQRSEDSDIGSSSPTKSDSSFKTYSSSTDISPLVQNNQTCEKLDLNHIENNSRLYLGLPDTEYYLIKLVTAEVGVDYRDILITLKKIRLNDLYNRMAVEFGISASNISRIICNALPKLAYFFNDFIYWPDKYTIELKQPTQFSIRYRQVQSVINCLEIKIQTAIDPLRQSQTWSNYKKGNTIKYLVSATPHGFINFISRGYGGRITDTEIVAKCGFLDVLPDDCHVMADRGFKHVSNLLMTKNCKLVRPPSAEAGKKMTKAEVTESKRIAALRIHIERVIRRLQEFRILSSHSFVNTKLIPWLDYIIIIACGIANVQ